MADDSGVKLLIVLLTLLLFIGTTLVFVRPILLEQERERELEREAAAELHKPVYYDKTIVGTGWRGIPQCERTSFAVGQPVALQIGAYRDTENNYLRMECLTPPSAEDIRLRRLLHLWGEQLVMTPDKFAHAEYLQVFVSAGASLVQYEPSSFSFSQGTRSFFVSRDDVIGDEGFEKGQELWPGETITGILAVPNEVDTTKQFELRYQGATGVFCGF